ncbi:PucR family transcriptional regulator ligand-binding domain-containing protein [Nocardiopsis coralliicola]
MPPTLGAVLRTPKLGLRLRGGVPGAESRPVRWVATSELTDPTPYLEGDELLLTTGVRWPPELGADEASAYVGRLADRGIAALGFGVGVAHADVPAAVESAAAEQGLPLVEVPIPTPFMAVGKAVSRLLAEAEYEGLTRAFAAQRRLTQAAPRGERAVVERLATELRSVGGAPARVLLLGPEGGVRHAVPDGAAELAADLADQLHRLAASGRPASASLVAAGDRVALQVLGVAGRVRGFLAVGTAHALGADERTLVSGAASLLSLELEHVDPVGGDLVGGLVAGLLDGTLPVADARRLRAALPAEPLEVALSDAPEEALPAAVGDRLLALLDGTGLVAALGPAGSDPGGLLVRLGGAAVGVGRADRYPALPAARSEAERALEAARARASAGAGSPGTPPVVRAEDLPGGFAGLVAGPAADRVADEVLAPVAGRRSAGVLLASLRAYLAAAGRWDAAAEALGVHRHTLRYRINRIRELLPGDLDDPDYRTELWLALRTRDRRP